MGAHESDREWLDLDEACRLFPFSRRTFFKLIADGDLRAYKPFRRKTLVRRRDVEQFILRAIATPPVDENRVKERLELTSQANTKQKE